MRLPNMRHAVVLVLAGILGSCNDQEAISKIPMKNSGYPSGNVSETSLSNLVSMSVINRCPDYKEGQSPADFEEPIFKVRNQDGLVVNGLNAGCVTDVYSKSQLEQWSDKNDPVAIYTLAVGYPEPIDVSCRRFNDLKTMLERAFDLGKSGRLVNNISRVPEAKIAIGILGKRCGMDGSDAYYVDADRFGLNAIEFFGGVW